MKHSFTTLLLLCSMAVIGQTKIDKYINAHHESNSLMFKTDNLVSFSLPLIVNNKGEIVPMPNVQDTVKVIMLATKRTDINKPVQLMQIEGYSVTPKYVFNALPRAYYLNINKQPLPDDVIVWMAIQK